MRVPYRGVDEWVRIAITSGGTALVALAALLATWPRAAGTHGRPIAAAVEKSLAGLPADLTVAVMGCMVNGPGEARDADLGVACGRSSGVLFRRGKLLRRVAAGDIAAELVREAKRLADPGASPAGSTHERAARSRKERT